MPFMEKHKRGALIGGILLLLVILVTAKEMARTGRYSESVSTNGGTSYDGDMVTPDVSAPRAPSMEDGSDESYGRGGVGISPPAPYPQTGGQTAAEVDQKIIKTGSLQLTVESVSEVVVRITDLATGRKGFVQSSSTTERADGRYEGAITIRVPSAEFETTMQAMKGFALVVNNETSSGQDVTEQYTDLQAQLRNAVAQETEYLRIMQQAKDVQDILAVQQQLGYVRGQIESLQGRIKYLENVTSYSTIQAYLTEEASVQVPTKEFRPGTVVKQAVQELINLGQAIVEGVIWLVIVGGGVLLPLLVLYWLGRAIVRAVRRSKGVTNVPPRR